MKKENKFLNGAIILTISSVVAKIIGAFYRVPLISLIGSKGLGIFQLVYPIYSFFLICITGGISLGISKLISVEVKENNFRNSKKILSTSLILMLIFSLVLSVLLLILSVPISSFQGDKNFYICYLALLPSLVICSLISVFRGYFQGLQNMLPSGVSQIIEQAVKLCASLYFAGVFIKQGLIYAVFGVFLGITISEVFALIYLTVIYLKKQKDKKLPFDFDSLKNDNFYNFKLCAKKILKTSFPIMLNSVILPLVYAIESIMTIWLLSKANIGSTVATSLFGLEDGIVSSLINLPTVIALSISTALLPNLSASFSGGNIKECEEKCKSAIKYSYLIALPCTFAFMLISKDLVLFLYGGGLKSGAFNELKIVADLVSISSLNILYVSLLNVITTILQAINKSFVPVKNLAICSLIKLILEVVLVSNASFNIYGLVISDVVCFSLAVILNLMELKKQLNIQFDIKNFILLPIVCCFGMVLVIECIKLILSGILSQRILTLSVVFVGVISYLLLLFTTKVINLEELPFYKRFKKR